MGETRVVLPKSKKEVQIFVKRILQDVKAFEKMLVDDLFEKKPIRIGAEQEFNLIDSHFRPLGKNMEVLKALNDEEVFTSELARFNLETNLKPQLFKGRCLSRLEKEINQNMATARKAAHAIDAEIILSGILPTIRKFDVEAHNLTPLERYRALCDAILKLKGSELELKITGIDELITKHESPLLEGCNTGFQVHLQVAPSDFKDKYNAAQAIAGPALAVGTFSPMLFGKRLWHETRIALFQQSVDTRTSGHHLRDRSPRVMFGNNWVEESILEIYREDLMRFKVMLSTTLKENSLEKLAAGKIPDLIALQIHNGTVYRWNRPCYGNAGGVPHMRIENRVLPAGPTVVDEMANAALWLGLVNGLYDAHGDITKKLEFADAKANFAAACRNGIDSGVTWINDTKYSVKELMLKELIPISRKGLEKAKVSAADIDKYLGIMEERVKLSRTGSNWMLYSYSQLIKKATKEEVITAITADSLIYQKKNIPVHCWEPATLDNIEATAVDQISVEEFMTTDLFTVSKDDIVELVSEIMNTQRIRYVPVEDDDHNLVGLVTSRGLLKMYSQDHLRKSKKPLSVEQVMIKNPQTIKSSAKITEAMEMMQNGQFGCLPVVNDGTLVGVISEQDFLKITARLLNYIKVKNT